MADLRGEEVSEQCKPNEMLQLSTGLEKLTWLGFHNKVKLFFLSIIYPKAFGFKKPTFLPISSKTPTRLGALMTLIIPY